MIVVGLTGGIAMGKSEVAKIFAAEGVPVFDADSEVHRFYDSAEGAALIAPLAPSAVTGGKVDRKALTAAVMSDATLLTRLEGVVHAEIRRRRADFVRHAEAQGHAMVLLDVPLLFETGADAEADVSITVSATPENQRRRAMARPGMTAEKLEMVLKRQMPDAEKRRRAGVVIETNGTLEELRARVLDVIRQIRDSQWP